MSGATIKPGADRTAGGEGDNTGSPLLEVRGLVKDYPGVRALGGVDLSVTSGQVHCLIGRTVPANRHSSSASLGWLSRPLGKFCSKARRCRWGIRARRSPVASPPSTKSSTWSRTCRSHTTCFGPRTQTGSAAEPGSDAQRNGALFARLGNEGISPTASVTTLRPAQQQVVSMARALSHSVKLLILDEPSAVLDDVEVDALFGVVRRLTAEGVGVIWISHRLGEVAELGDVVTVLKEGRT